MKSSTTGKKMTRKTTRTTAKKLVAVMMSFVMLFYGMPAQALAYQLNGEGAVGGNAGATGLAAGSAGDLAENPGGGGSLTDSDALTSGEADDQAGGSGESPAFEQSQTVDGVTVTVQAEAGAFPQGATLQVKPVPVWTEAIASAKVDQVRDTSREVAASYTFDIKVLGADGAEAQPADGKKVNVAFNTREVADESLSTEVFHIDSATGEPEQLEVSAEAETATVEVDGFSIYVVKFAADGITVNDPNVVTYKFYNGTDSEPVQSQVVKAGDKLYEPSVPSMPNQQFEGWYIGNEKLNFGADGTTQIDTLHTATNGIVTVNAKFGTYHYVTFYNQDGNVHSRIGVADGGSITEGDVPAFKPERASQTFDGWRTEDSATSNVSFPIEEIKADVSYYPTISEKFVVSFDVNRSSAAGMAEDKGDPENPNDDIPGVNVSYTAPLLVDPGQPATKPADPHAELSVYTFNGWYTDPTCAAGTLYDWTKPVEDNITLYAGWKVGTTSYQIVVMKEKSSVKYNVDDPTSRDALIPGNYEFFKSYTMSNATVGSTVSVPSEHESLTPEHGFVLPSYGTPSAKKVLPDGSTSLYVYWNREVRSVSFYILSNKQNTSTNSYATYKTKTLDKTYTGLYGQNFDLYADRGYTWDASKVWYAGCRTFNNGNMSPGLESSATAVRLRGSFNDNLYPEYYAGSDDPPTYNCYDILQQPDGSWVNSESIRRSVTSGAINAHDLFQNFKVSAYSVGYKEQENQRTTVSEGGDIAGSESDRYVYHSRDKFTVTFYEDATTVLETKDVFWEGTLPSAVPTFTPTDPMLSFKGWSTTQGDTDPSHAFNFSGFKMPDYNIRFYPILVSDAIRVVLDTNADGDTVTMAGLTEYWPMPGAPIDMTNMNNATRDGYKLDGWYLKNGERWTDGYAADLQYCDKEGANYVTYTDTTYGNKVYTITLKAKWNFATEAPVSYDLGSGGGSISDESIYVFNGKIKVSETPPTPPEGYVFVGWQDITNAVHLPGETFVFDTNNLVLTDTDTGEKTIPLTALYIKQGVPTATITYHANYEGDGGNETTASPKAYDWNETLVLPGENLSRSGYRIYGWSTEADNNPEFNIGANVGVSALGTDVNAATNTGNIDLYAVWETSHTITYNATAGGTVSPASELVSARVDAKGATATPSEGYHFVKWTKASDESWESTATTLVPAKPESGWVDETYTAKFELTHVHDWTFVASGNAVTATCADGDGAHGTPKSATLTISADGGEFNDSEIGATLSGNDVIEAATGGNIKSVAVSEIVYEGVAPTSYGPSNTAPKNAGEYTASVTVTVTDSDNAVSIYTANKAFSITKNNDTTKDNLNADGSQSPQKVTGLEYNGVAHELVTAPTAALPEGYDSITYTVVDSKGNTVGTSTSPNLPEATAADTYTVKVTYKGNANHADFTSDDIRVSIAPKPVTVTAAQAAKSKDYGASDDTVGWTVDLTVDDNEIVSGDTVTATLAREAGEDVVDGGYVYKGATSSNPNYTISVESAARFTIKKRGVTMTSASAEKERWDGTALTATSTPEVSGDGFADGEGVTFDVTGSQTLVGSSNNTFTYNANAGTSLGNYEITQVLGKLTVKGSPIRVEMSKPETKEGGYSIGDVVEFTITVRNVSAEMLDDVAVSDPTAVADASAGISIADDGTVTVTSIASDGTVTITVKHTVTADDIAAGTYTNTATAKTADNAYTETVSVTMPDPTDPDSARFADVSVELAASKVVTSAAASYDVGDEIAYKVVVENKGNVDVKGVKVTDPLTGRTETVDIAAGGKHEMPVSYTVTENDVKNGSMADAVTAKGEEITTPKGEKITPQATDNTNLDVTLAAANASYKIEKTETSTPEDSTKGYQVGETITYDIKVTNDGNLTLENIKVTDAEFSAYDNEGNLLDDPLSQVIEKLAPGASVTIKVGHVVTADDVLGGGVTIEPKSTVDEIDNPQDPEVPIKPKGDDGEPVKNDKVEAIDAKVSVSKVETSVLPEGETYKVGDTITFTVTVKNEGNVPVTEVQATDGSFTAAGTVDEIAPGESKTITMTHVVTAADVAAGGVSIQETVTAKDIPNPKSESPITVSVTGDKVTVSNVAKIPGDKKALVDNAPEAAVELTYNGSDQNLVSAPELPDGYDQVQYRIKAAEGEEAAAFTTSIPAKTNAGDYVVEYQFVDTTGARETIGVGETGTITINKLNISSATVVTEPDEVVYSGSPNVPTKVTVTAKVMVGNEEKVLTVPATDYSFVAADNVNVGKATVTVTVGENSNFTGSKVVKGKAEGAFDITAQPVQADSITVTFPSGDETPVYDGTPQKPVPTVVVGSGAEAVELVYGKDFEVVYPEDSTSEGEKTATVKLIGNYSGEKAGQSYSVAKRPLTVNIEEQTVTYGQAIDQKKYTAGEPAKDQTISVELVQSTTDATNGIPGEITANVKVTAGEADVTANYDITAAPAKLVIEKAALTVGDLKDNQKPSANTDLTYNGDDQALVTPPAADGDVPALPEGYTKVQYSTNNGETWVDEVPTGINAKEYPIAVKYVGDENHVDLLIGAPTLPSSVTIAPKSLDTGGENPVNAEGITVQVEPPTLTYNGKDQSPAITVKDGTTVLVEGVDYTLEGASGKDVGTYTVKVIGKEGGNYTGMATAQFKIAKQQVDGKDISITFEDANGNLLQDTFIYNGSDQRPAADQVVVKVGDTKLTLGKDYVLEYPEKGSIDADSYAVKVKLMNNYSGEASKGYTIKPKELKPADVTLTGDEMIYRGSPQGPTVTVKDGSKTLVEDESYTLADEEKTEQGEYTLTVSGTGNYTGTVTKPYKIAPYAIGSDDKVIVTFLDGQGQEIGDAFTYNGLDQTPKGVKVVIQKADGSEVELKDSEPDQFDVTFPGASINAGGYEAVVTLKGDYSGTTKKGYKIEPKPLTAADIEKVFSPNPSTFTYNETAQGPTVSISDLAKNNATGNPGLEENTDYKVDNATATGAGSYVMTVTGTGNYTGTLTQDYVINKRAATEEPGEGEPNVTTDDKSITVKPTKPGYEYIVTTSEDAPEGDWSEATEGKGYYKENGETEGEVTFNGLDAGTQYYVHVRKAETPNENPSGAKTASAPTKPSAPSEEDVAGAVNVDYDTETLTTDSGYELYDKNATDPATGEPIIDPATGEQGAWVTKVEPFVPEGEYPVRKAASTDGAGNTIPPSDPATEPYVAPKRPGAPSAVDNLDKSDRTITVVEPVDTQEYIVLPAKDANGNEIVYSDEDIRQAFENAAKDGASQDGVTFDKDANGDGLQPGTDYVVYNRVKAVVPDPDDPSVVPAIASAPAGPTSVTTKTASEELSEEEKKGIADKTWDDSTANPKSIVVNGEDGYEYLVVPADATDEQIAALFDSGKAAKCPGEGDGAFENKGTAENPDYVKEFTKDSNGADITPNKDYRIVVRKSETPTAMPSEPVKVDAYTTQEPPAPGEGYGVDYPGETITIEPGYEIVAKSPEGTEPTEWAPNEKYPAAEDGTTVIPLTPGATYEVRKKADPDAKPPTHESTPTAFTVDNRPETPEAVGGDDIGATDTTVTVDPTDPKQEYVVLPVKRGADGKVVPYTDEEIDEAMKNAGKDGTGGALEFAKDGNGDPIKPGQEYIVANRTKAVPATTDDEGNVVTDENGKATGSPASKPAQSEPVKTQHSTPAKPEVTADTTSVTVSPASADQEYSIDGGKTWVTPEAGADGKAQDVVFGGLTPGQEYEVIARAKATDTGRASESTEPVKVTTPKADWGQSGEAEKPAAGSLPTQVTLSHTVPGQEYIIVPKGTQPSEADWSTAVRPGADGSVSFDRDASGEALVPGAEYTVLTRVPGDATHEPGEPTSISVKTPRGAGADVMDGVNAEGGVAPMTDDKGSFVTKDGKLVKKGDDGKYYYADKDGNIADGAKPLEKGADGSLSDADGKVEFQPAVMLVGTNPGAADNVKGKLDSLPEDDESVSVELPVYDAQEHAPSAYDNAVLDKAGVPKGLEKGKDFDVAYYRPGDIDASTGLPRADAVPLNPNDPDAADYAFDAGETVAVVQFKGDYAGTVAVPVKIEKREFHVVTPSDSKQYDGTPLTAPEPSVFYADGEGNKVQDGLIGGQTVEVKVTGSQTASGSSRNTYKLRFKGEQAATEGAEVGEQSAGGLNAQSVASSVAGFLGVQAAYADASTGLTADGEEPTAKRKNYAEVSEAGTLTVEPVDVSGQTGIAGSKEAKRVSVNPIPSADDAKAAKPAAKGTTGIAYTGKAIASPVIFDTGVTDAKGNPKRLVEGEDYDVAYYDEDGNPVENPTDAGKYRMVVTFKGVYAGTFETEVVIDPAELSVTTPSATKVHDGKALTAEEGAKLEGLVNGETATLKVTGTQTSVGTSDNTYEIAWDGTAKEGNYAVADEDLGTLEVTAEASKSSKATPRTGTAPRSSTPKTGDELPWAPWAATAGLATLAILAAGLRIRRREDGRRAKPRR